MTPPSHVKIDISDADIAEDLVHIISSMESLRQEQINGNTSSEKRNEYLHLAYRLGSAIEATADKQMATRFQSVLEKVNANPALLQYDYLQDQFWRKAEPEFSRTLDNILLFIKGDAFNGLQEKHHLFNALKYIGSKEEPLKERLRIYDTILPFHSTTSSNSHLISELEQKLKSEVKIDGTVLNIGYVNNPQLAIELATNAGFQSLTYLADKKDTLPNGAQHLSEGNHLLPTSKRGELFAAAITHPVMKLISYPLIGALPGRLQERIKNYVDRTKYRYEFNNLTASMTNRLVEGFGLIGAGAYAFWERSADASYPVSYLLASAAIGIGLVVNITGRYFIAGGELGEYSSHGAERPVGSIFTLPLHIVEQILNRFTPRNPMQVQINLKWKPQEPNLEVHNFHPVLEQIAVEQEGSALNQNLVWSMENHHTQGEYYTKNLNGEKRLSHFKKNNHLNRTAGGLAVHDLLISDPYRKHTAFISFPDERYVFTLITQKDNPIDYEELIDTLRTNTPEQSAKALMESTRAQYLHFSRITGKKTYDSTFIEDDL